jgi:hypothetical protein
MLRGAAASNRPAGIDRNMRDPGPLASNLVQTGQSGGFFDDYCNWQRTIHESPAAELAAVHGARGNDASARRRVLSLRWVGDDVRYAERPGRTSPPFPGHGMVTGQRLREDWFPVIRPAKPANLGAP